MSFRDFLHSQIDRKDPVGYLAKKVRRNKKIKCSYEDIYSYLYYTHASEEEIHALKNAFYEYSGERLN